MRSRSEKRTVPRLLNLTVAVTFVAALAPAPPAGAKEETIKEADVPAPVLAAVKKRYPAARLLKFEKELENGKTCYEVELREGKKTLEVKLSSEGELQEEEELISLKELPEAVLKGFQASAYGKHKVKKVERVFEANKQAPTKYEVEVADKGKTLEVYFDPEGKLLSTEEE